eukprot:2421434-Pyramimonas_sp.AAC.1
MASQVEQRLNGVETIQRVHTKQLQVLHEEVKQLKRELNVVKETPSEMPTVFPKLSLDSAFNRAIDASIIVVRCKEQTTKHQ